MVRLVLLKGGKSEDVPAASDEELVRAAQAGNEDSLATLIRRYEGAVHIRAGRYYAPGLEYEDLVQEGMIGLYKAVMSYRQRRSPFRTSAYVHIDSSLKTAVTTARREKHHPVNSRLSLEQEICDEKTYRDVIPGMAGPEEVFALKETVSEVMDYINRNLSRLERTAILTKVTGAPRTYRYNKTLYNARQRAVRKLRRAFPYLCTGKR
jgi:RNA polymerase sporulation-specific sigma factor